MSEKPNTVIALRDHGAARLYPSCGCQQPSAPALPPQRSGSRQQQIVGNSVSEEA